MISELMASHIQQPKVALDINNKMRPPSKKKVVLGELGYLLMCFQLTLNIFLLTSSVNVLTKTKTKSSEHHGSPFSFTKS